MLKFIKVLTQTSIKKSFLAVLLTNLFVLMIGLGSQLLFLGVKMLLMNLLKQFLRSVSTVEKNEKTFSQKFDHERKRRRTIPIK